MTRIPFDNIVNQSSVSGTIPNGYYNLNWNNIQYINVSTILDGGYQTLMSVPPYVIHNPTGSAMTITSTNGTRFFFNSFNTTAAWRNNLLMNIQGYRSGTLTFNFTTPIFVSNQTVVRCSSSVCSDLDTLIISTSRRITVSGLNGTGTQMVIDDFCVSFGY